MPLSEHVYCVAFAFQMTEGVEQWICIIFCVKFGHSSVETIWMIQEAAAMGTWWLAASSQHSTCSCITYHQEFFGETSNYPVDLAPLQPRFGALRFLAFPKTKITCEWKGRDFRPWVRFRKRQWGSWWWLGELCEVPQCLLWRGLRCHCLVYNVSCIFFSKCLYFSYYMAGHLLDRPHIYGVWDGWKSLA